MSKPIIIGNKNTVVPGTEDVQAIFCDGQNFSEDDEGYNYIQNKNIRMNDSRVESSTMIINATFGITHATKTADFTAGAEAYNAYFVDATGGNIDITIEIGHIPIWFVRIDGSANTVTITPDSGLINGAASYGLNTQYEKIHVLCDDTNFYF